ncbi:phosphate-selective porin OprO and OprP [Pseudoxanthomonas sp. GM95]|uniref:OprO/OprP family phosphate-selective porin n=1 Tax=Pseudoxanthomonas sp. GM95 TaxID=1881043 RepID=UPI0008D319A5|nr:porin [Pseudoxanthomonas sp. GM95]SEM35866.1 phosphate-selective porin OprO and OprP [Pseudoxanthomonas sp. GM95]
MNSKHYRTTALLTLAVATALAAPLAQAETKLDSNGFNASSDDGQYTFGIHGRVQFDGGWFDNDDLRTDNANGTELRRVRLAVSGKFGDWGYVVDYDFANDKPVGQTIAISHDLGPGSIAIGQIKPFYSLEYTTDDLWASMQERSWVADTQALGYRYGASWVGNTKDKQWIYGINVYNEANTDTDRNSGLGESARLVWLPLAKENGLLHLGVSGGHDEIGRNQNDVYTGTSASVRAAGHLSDQSRFTLISLNDGSKVDINKYLGEVAYSRGPFYVQSEAGKAHYEDGAQDGDLKTGYATVGWFITGQTRGYDFKKARFTRPDGIGEHGAWEVALRYDTAHGEQVNRDIEVKATTLGVNYYANKNVMFRLNYIHSDAQDNLAHATLDKTNAITGRMQIAF